MNVITGPQSLIFKKKMYVQKSLSTNIILVENFVPSSLCFKLLVFVQFFFSIEKDRT